MNPSTDLAIECKEYIEKEPLDGVICDSCVVEDTQITRIQIINKNGQRLLNKPVGDYITLESKCLLFCDKDFENNKNILSRELDALLPKNGLILIAGLGNEKITSDSLGCKCIDKISSLKHIKDLLQNNAVKSRGRTFACIKTNISANTGIESTDVIDAFVKRLNPSAVIVIDSLAARNIKRIANVIQISTGGITPGSGIGNNKRSICKNTLNVPVISIGMPTVADAFTLIFDACKEPDFVANPDIYNMFATVKNIDLVVESGAELISLAINSIIQNKINITEL